MTWRKAAVGFIALVFTALLQAGGLAAQPWDGDYELRAQEVVAGLTRINGLRGWDPLLPADWPEGRGRPGAAAAGARWSRDGGLARLEELSLEGLGLTRAADFSGLTALKMLEASGNSLKGLNVDGDAALVFLGAQKNQLTSLRVGGCPNLTHLAVGSNQLEALDLSANPRLRELTVSKNRLSELEVSPNPELVNLEAMNNRLTRLTVAANPRLIRLMVSYNGLSELDVSANRELAELGVRDNRLTALDLKSNPALVELAAGRNGLRELDLSANPSLARLAVDQNLLVALDLSRNPDLVVLEAQRNPLSEIRLGENRLENLGSLNLDGCRLPLSQLALLSGKARSRARFGDQENVLFERLNLARGQTLDLSAEADLDGTATVFTVLNDKKRRARPEEYELLEGGLVTFHRPGRFLVMMTNDRVVSSETNRLTGRIRTFKVKVYTGSIDVAPLADSGAGETP